MGEGDNTIDDFQILQFELQMPESDAPCEITLLEQLREMINDTPYINKVIKNRVKWYQFWTAFDTLNQTNEAISIYKQLDGVIYENGGLLHIYGLLQILYVQQDAIKFMYEFIIQENFNLKQDFPELSKIREIRNDTIGHPTSRKNGAFFIIDPFSISKKGFEYLNDNPEQPTTFQKINLFDIINEQEKIINKIVEQLIIKIQMELREHKEKFKGTLLAPKMQKYHSSLGKIFDYISPNSRSNCNTTSISLKELERLISVFESEVRDRYFGDLNEAYMEVLLNLKFALNKVRLWITDEKEYENEETNIYYEAINKYFDDLHVFALEIDEEFNLEQ